MENLKWLEIAKQHNYDMAEDMIKRHIELYGEYKRDDEIIEKILNDADKIKEKIIRVKEIIENIHDPITKAFIKEKFVNGENWERISEKIGYSESYLYNLYSRAMKDPEIAEIKKILSR